jgi:SAM-dependent methyltransferase
MTPKPTSYLMAGQASELERLQLQSRVWEPAGQALLAELPAGIASRALEAGCGVMGWLRLLSEWVGPTGEVVGSDVDPKMLACADEWVRTEGLANVRLVEDNLFDSKLTAASFDLVHARFQIAPLGRADEQVRAYRSLLRPGGTLVLEDPDMASWRVNPEAPAVQELIALIDQGFRAAGGNFNAGRELPALLRGVGMEPKLTARIVALEPGHPYLRLPLQFAASLRPRLQAILPPAELATLLQRAEAELARPDTWGTTFTLIQAVATAPVPAEGKDPSP